MKVCRKCGEKKELSSFAKHPKGINGVDPTCRDCKNAKAKVYYANNKDRLRLAHKIRRRNDHAIDIKRKFGITIEQYNELSTKQNGLCAICKSPVATRRLAVDHNHHTGAVRGLLCGRCNLGLGMFRDNPELLFSAQEYLKRFVEN